MRKLAHAMGYHENHALGCKPNKPKKIFLDFLKEYNTLFPNLSAVLCFLNTKLTPAPDPAPTENLTPPNQLIALQKGIWSTRNINHLLSPILPLYHLCPSVALSHPRYDKLSFTRCMLYMWVILESFRYCWLSFGLCSQSWSRQQSWSV